MEKKRAPKLFETVRSGSFYSTTGVKDYLKAAQTGRNIDVNEQSSNCRSQRAVSNDISKDSSMNIIRFNGNPHQ